MLISVILAHPHPCSFNLAIAIRQQQHFVRSGHRVTVHALYGDLSWAGIAQERIRAYLVELSEPGSVVGIIFVHPGPGDRSTFLAEAQEIAGLGAACLLVDAPWSDGAQFGRRAMSSSTEELRLWYIQIAVDLRRSLDLLENFPRIDKARIGFVGHSFGALFWGILAGTETRIATTVLMSGGEVSRMLRC